MTQKDTLNKLFKIVESYQSEESKCKLPVLKYEHPKELERISDLKITKEGNNYEKLFSDVEKYLQYSVKTNHHQFFNQLYSGENFPALIGEFVSSLSNTSMYTYEVAPMATLIEKELIQKMCHVVGFNDGGGTFATGGSNANMLAMMSARNKKLPEVNHRGLHASPVLTAFVSDQAHYSFDTAANILGIGSKQVYKVKSDPDGKMRIDDLVRWVEHSIQKDETPFFIAATAGTTLLGAFDPIDEIAEIANNYGIWLHLDGSFGGSIILSDKYKHLFNGIEKIDSFTWNPHKLMNIPLIASVLLLKDKTRLTNNLTDLNTDYIYHDNEVQEYNLGKQSIQCGRRVDAFKVWLAWRFFGDKGYADRINRMFELSQFAKKKIETLPNLELLAEPQSLTLCFIYKSKQTKSIDDLNLAIREELMKKGLTLVNYGHLKGKVAIRLVISNPDISEKDLNDFFQHFVRMGKSIENKTSSIKKRNSVEKYTVID